MVPHEYRTNQWELISNEKENMELPDEVQEEILARVQSIASLLHLRLVCRSWNSLLQSPSFAKLHRQMSPPEPWLLTVKGVNPSNQKLFLCDRSMEKWLQPPLHIPKDMECDLSTSVSSGGLLCCLASLTRRGQKSVLVFNPFARAFHMLPPPPFTGEWWTPLLRLAVWRDPVTNNYKVALCDTRHRHVQVYDSRTRKWHAGSQPPFSDGIRPRFEGYRNRRKDRLFWYDMKEDKWMEASVPDTGPLELRSPTIIRARKGQIRLAGVLTPGDSRTSGFIQGFGLWKLDCGDDVDEWVEISRTPARLWKGLRGILHRLSDSKLVCHEDIVCLSGITRPSISPWGCFYPRLLLYDPSHDSWEWSPQPMGSKTWSNYDSIAILEPHFEDLPT